MKRLRRFDKLNISIKKPKQNHRINKGLEIVNGLAPEIKQKYEELDNREKVNSDLLILYKPASLTEPR